MGLFTFIKGQFIEVIEWMENTESIVYHFPAYDNAIKNGSPADRSRRASSRIHERRTNCRCFGPGRYQLSTQNMPVLTALKSWAHTFNSPFKADVYFVNTTTIVGQKWGTTNPVLMRDKEFGIVRVRAFGNYSFKVKIPPFLFEKFPGSDKDFNAEE